MGRPVDELTEGTLRGEVSSIFETASLQYGFKPIVTGADRHGSFVWEATRRDELARTITVSFTPHNDTVLAQGWATASDGSRFARKSSKAWFVSESAFDAYVNNGDGGLRGLIRWATDAANHLNEADLSEHYSVAAEKAP
jgi:hypothetical protein